MSLVIDANMKLFKERLDITSSRMIDDYGSSTIDEIIEAEANKGNQKAIKYAQEYYTSPQKLIDVFHLNYAENRHRIISTMDEYTQMEILPLLDQYDLTMGLYFFTQEALFEMLLETNSKELINVALEAYSFEQIMELYTEEDFACFFQQDDLSKDAVCTQMFLLPADIMQKFIESVTGMPEDQTDITELVANIMSLPDDEYKKFMASIDVDVQRQLTYQLIKERPEYMMLFPNKTYVNMLYKLDKPEMIKSMAVLEKDTLVDMLSNLPKVLLSIVTSQVSAGQFAKFLQHGKMSYVENALMI